MLLGAAFIAPVINAQTQDLLDPVTVTATISPTAASKTGRNIIVIQGSQFSRLPVNSVDELLRYLPGVEMQARGPMGMQSDIVIRGGTFQQVLVILDGIRLNDPLTGHFSSYIPIAPAEIDRIEVLKGASSAIYGSEAVGGVIHIITKSFARSAQKSGLQAQVTGGEYGLFNANAGGVWRNEKNTLAGGILSNHANGQLQRGTRGFFDLTTASLSYSRKLNDNWQVAARSAYDYRYFSAQNYYTTFASDTGAERVKSNWNHIQVKYNRKSNRISLDAGYKTASDWYQYNKASLANENKTRVLQALLTWDKTLHTSTSLSSGLQYIQKKITSNDRGNHSIDQAAAFVVLHQSFAKYFRIDPSLRLDWNESYAFELVPQLNVSFQKNALQLRGSIGKTIRDADFSERYNNYNKAFVTSGRIGNAELQAERSLSYETGADYILSKTWKVSATYFNRDQSKLIDWITTPYSQMPRQVNLSPTGTYALAQNIASVQTSGFETDLQFTHAFNNNNNNLQANLGLVWLKSRSDAGEPSFYLSTHARFMTNFSLVYSSKWFTVSMNGVYKVRSAQKAAAINAEVTKNYFVVNGKAEITPLKWLGIFVQVDNIGDVKYADLLGCPMPQRWLMGGIKANF